MAAILKITPKNHFRNENSIGDMSGLEKHGKMFIKKLVLEDHGGGGAGGAILHVRLNVI